MYVYIHIICISIHIVYLIHKCVYIYIYTVYVCINYYHINKKIDTFCSGGLKKSEKLIKVKMIFELYQVFESQNVLILPYCIRMLH